MAKVERFDAVYARQSVDKKDSVSIETQIEDCKVICDEKVMEYADKGYSGKNTERPDLRRLIADVERGIIKKIVVYKLDRISRNINDVFCKPFLHKIAKCFCRLLHLHFVGDCKASTDSYSASHKTLQTLFNCYSTRYGNGSSEFSSSCACSLK